MNSHLFPIIKIGSEIDCFFISKIPIPQLLKVSSVVAQIA